MRKKWIGLTLGAALLCAPVWAAVLWTANFEGGSNPGTLATEPCGDKTGACGCGVGTSLKVSTQYKREGTYSGQAVLSKCHERAEWREITANHAVIGEKRYYGFSLKTPSNFDTGRWTIVHQMIQWYEGIPNWANTGGWHMLKIDNGRWIYRIKYSQAGAPTDVRTIEYDLGDVRTNTWTDFVVYGDWRADSGGDFEVYIRQQGEPGYTKKGSRYNAPVMLDVPKAPVFKVGLYRGDPNWTGVNSQDSIFVDSIRVGTTFNEAAVP